MWIRQFLDSLRPFTVLARNCVGFQATGFDIQLSVASFKGRMFHQRTIRLPRLLSHLTPAGATLSGASSNHVTLVLKTASGSEQRFTLRCNNGFARASCPKCGPLIRDGINS